VKDFRRVFVYVWSQWHRLLVVVLCALVIAALYSLSFATISPLLTVMMGQEGLHGWTYRKITSARYGIKFEVTQAPEEPGELGLKYYLQVSRVVRGSTAEQAGLRSGDRIVGAGGSLLSEAVDRVESRRLLEEMATAKDRAQIPVQVERLDAQGRTKSVELTVAAGPRPFYYPAAEKMLRSLPADSSKEHKRKAVIFILVLMLFVTLVRCVARFFQDYTGQKVVNVALARLRETAFAHSLELPVGFLLRDGPTDAVSRLVNDIGRIGNGIKVVLGKTLREPLKATGLIIGAMMVDRNLTLIFLCAAPLSLLVLHRFGSQIKRRTTKSLVSWAMMLGKLKEALGSIEVVKVYNQQQYERVVFERVNRKLLKQQLRIAKISAAAEPVLESLAMLAATVGLVFGASWVFSGGMPPSDFFMLLFFLGGAADSIRRVSGVWNRIQQSNAAAVRVFELIDQVPEQEKPNAFDIGPLRDRIEFRDVVFSYPGSDKPALNRVNLSVGAGQNVAIVGPNGSGKTTLAKLIPRFYDPDSGQILIDGRDIRDATLRSLRSQIGMVTQNVVTFNDTIAANIAYGRPGATEEQIIEAAKRSFAHEFVEVLPNGYQTVIGEDGAGLSGGQLQRIVIARAILKDPAILIFDEATSQVDADSEAKIHKAIEEIMRDRTSFVIAHRFSTIINADLIVVMNEGQVIAEGQHDELMQTCSLYQSLYETQLIRA